VADGAVPEVHVSAERRPEGWCVTVADNGIGVDPARREEVFGMFRRLHSRDEYDGTGIGLAICKRIVVRRGGSIWVEGNPPGGSRFRFTIPDWFGAGRSGPGQGSKR
jgi:light-regulated signal transduction histidine kinase (bacteriophytochrome)